MFLKYSKLFCTVLAIALLLSLAGCASGTDKNTTKSTEKSASVDKSNDGTDTEKDPTKKSNKISIRLQWAPQAQFAGYYVAKAKGFYKDAGLDVDVLPGGPNINGFLDIAQNKAQFATGWLSTAITNVASGAYLTCVGQYFPKSMLILVTKKKSGITSIKQMTGRTVGLWDGGVFTTPIKAAMNINNVTPKYVSQGFEVDDFVNDKMDVASAMTYNEINMIREQMKAKGENPEELVIFNLAQNGVNFPEDGLYVSSEYRKNNPETVKKVVDATLKGWNYAIENPTEALSIVMNEIKANGGNAVESHQRYMLETVTKGISGTNNKAQSSLEEKDFKFVVEKLKQNKVLEQSANIDYKTFYQPVN